MAKNKKTTAITILLILSFAISLIAVPLATAQTNYPVFAYINAAPNPVGAGQKVDILIWTDKYRSGANLFNDYRMHNYRLRITDADGDLVLNQFWDTIIDTTSSQYYPWIPTAAGTYTLNFTFEGFLASDWPSRNTEQDYYFMPDSASTTLVVQDDPLPTPITSYPLPQEYWTRPIYGENTDWWAISSNWLGTGAPGHTTWSNSIVRRAPTFAVGSQTAHVMWTKPLQDGGVVGGNDFLIPGATYFEGSAYSQRWTNTIIVGGRLYYRTPVSYRGSNSGPTYCVDLRSGEVIWVNNDLPTLSFAYVFDVQNPNQHGTYPPILFTSNFGRAFDAYTGDPLFNVTSVPSGTTVMGDNGEHLRYTFFNNGTSADPDWYLCQWNSSKLWRGATWATDTTGNSPDPDTTTTTTTDWEWINKTIYVNDVPQVISENVTTTRTTTAVQANMGKRYDWNASINSWRVPLGNPSVIAAFKDDVMICRAGSLPTVTRQTPYTYFAVSLKPESRGQLLWQKTYTAPPGNVTVVDAYADPLNRVFVLAHKETRLFEGFSMTDGSHLWTTDPQPALDYYGNPAFPYIPATIYDGKLYSSALAGIVYCYDTATGEKLWEYGSGGEGNSTNSGFYLAYGHYPTFINAIGNGVVYTVTTEHTVNTPIYKGAKTRAINATDGTEIWTISAYVGEFFAMSLVIADGFTSFFNGYDNQLYTVGRGPSATTVSAPDVASPFGAPVVMKGTVTDISAGTKQDEQAARFPQGVPAASDESMTEWMGYVYQQRPLPDNFVGVTVTLSVLDANNNCREIGTATTDANGFYNFEYLPEIPGKYTVYATFEGTNGYWPSSAVSAFTVMEAEEPAPEPEPEQPSIADTYFVPAVAGIIAVLIIVVVLLALLLLKKR
jgi:outer membrane protein assembly factor BamB